LPLSTSTADVPRLNAANFTQGSSSSILFHFGISHFHRLSISMGRAALDTDRASRFHSKIILVRLKAMTSLPL
jgi:hypothetical protein